MTDGPSPHLRWSELGCRNRLTKDGVPVPFEGIAPGGLVAVYPLDWRPTRGLRLGLTFEAIRAATGVRLGKDCPIALGSAYRTRTYDAAVGGASNTHPKGLAMDLHTPDGLTVEAFHALILALAERDIPEIGGVGFYPAWGVHVDHRPRKGGPLARWNG